MNTWAILADLLAVKNKGVLDERLLWATGALVAALLGGAAVLALVDRWRKRQFSDAAAEADPLTPFREMYARGEITKEEYQHIRGKLAEHYYEIANKPAPGGGDGSATPKPNEGRAEG